MTICLALIGAIVQRDRPRFVASSPKRTFHPAAADLWTSRRRRAGSTSRDLGTILRSPYPWHLGLIYMGFGIAFLIYFTFFQKRLM